MKTPSEFEIVHPEQRMGCWVLPMRQIWKIGIALAILSASAPSIAADGVSGELVDDVTDAMPPLPVRCYAVDPSTTPPTVYEVPCPW